MQRFVLQVKHDETVNPETWIDVRVFAALKEAQTYADEHRPDRKEFRVYRIVEEIQRWIQ